MAEVKKVLKALLVLLIVLVAAVAGLIGYLSLAEYRPEAVEPLEVTQAARHENVRVGERLDVLTFNTGYAGLGRNQDFFMDGGQMVRPDSRKDVEQNLGGILSALSQKPADVYMLQEVDFNSYRSYYLNEGEYYRHGLSMNMAKAYNYKCEFVPFPWPPIRKVESGLVTFTSLNVTDATRESLPVPFQWPVRVANLKRCLLIERVPVEGTDKELVLINLHLEAYDDGEGKQAQTKQLMEILAAEYRNGNYVIAGGDFNQTFEEADVYPVLDETYWRPGKLYVSELPKGFSYVYDASSPTCRLLNKPYDGNRDEAQLFVIDGFIVSDNLKVNHVETIDLNFACSDHNPVFLQVTPQ